MVFGSNPVILLINVPLPLLSVVWLSLIVGLVAVSQQIPRAVTDAPPLSTTLPPEMAELSVILLTAVVVTVGKLAIVVNVISLP